MSLNYDISRIAKSQLDLIESVDPIVSKVAWELTQGMIFQTLSVGIGKLTEESAVEFYGRQRIWNLINGFTPYTPLEVKLHIGLSTNVAYETPARWKSRTMRNALQGVGRMFATEGV